MQKHARIRQERRRRHRFSFRSFHASASVVRRSSNVSLSFSFARDLCRDDDDDDNKVVCSFVRDDDEAIALDIGRDIFSSKAEETRESSLTTRRSSQLVEYVCTRLSFFLSFFFVWDVFQFSPILPIFVHLFCNFFFRLVFKKNKCACNERTNETIKRKKEKNNKKNDRLRSGDRTRAYSGHSREFRDDERDEEEIGRLARMGERFKGTSSSSSFFLSIFSF